MNIIQVLQSGGNSQGIARLPLSFQPTEDRADLNPTGGIALEAHKLDHSGIYIYMFLKGYHIYICVKGTFLYNMMIRLSAQRCVDVYRQKYKEPKSSHHI